MKNYLLLVLALLTVSGVAVSKEKEKTGATLEVSIQDSQIKVLYKAEDKQQVKVEILDKNNKVVFADHIRSKNFLKPYNISLLKDGKYTINVTDNNGNSSTNEFVRGDLQLYDEDFQYVMINPMEEYKVAITAVSGKQDVFNLIFKDSTGNVIHDIYKSVSKPSGTIYDFSNLKIKNVTVEVTNKEGKKIKTVTL